MTLGRALEAAALLVAGASAAWAALACRSARQDGRAGADGRVWSALALIFIVMAVARVAHLGPSLGADARAVARALDLYRHRRPYQIAATAGLVTFAIVAMGIGLRSIWNVVRRYRLAAGCLSVVLASALIRFVSLNEVDAWNAEWPWFRVVLDVGTSAIAAAVATARVHQLARTRPGNDSVSRRP